MKPLVWLRSRLLYKMLLSYSLLTLIPLSIVSVTYYMKAEGLLEKKSTQAAQETLDAAAVKLDGLLSALSRTMYNIGTNQLILSLLEYPDHVQHDKLKQAALNLLQGEKEEVTQKIGDYIDTIYLKDMKGNVYSLGSKSAMAYSKAFDIMPFDYDYIPEWALFTDRGRMACNMKLFDKSTGAEIGRMVLMLDADKIPGFYSQFERNHFYVTNSNNVIVSAAEKQSIGKILNVQNADKVVALTQKSRYSDFHYIYLAPAKPGEIITKQAFFSVYVTILAWLSVIVITFWMLRKVTVPITKLTRLMRRAGKEDYALMDGIHTQDEIAVLCHGYNHLIDKTQEHIEKTYKAELLQKEAELKAIRMYINPHFLYNTLEHISILSRSPGTVSHIPDVVGNLADIFRFSIYPGETIVTLATELMFAEKYLQIHQYRYKGRLQYEIDIEEELRNMTVPKLIIQPIVENAILHGIDKHPEGGRILITVYEENLNLIVDVENTVCEEEMETVGDRRKGLGSGMENVNARIVFHYGNGYGAQLIRYNERTVARLTLPIII
ncbi:sensor histidine kinase [Paenibacillus nasutitermitis]|uniref:Histidine kinase n=1 Tax=Paenibacillus nasutitermitis TaxID=1652958 RepID=A0A917DPP3_9BACL|nr:histidine kinase [Paenibacillus nasutitermitis]GGD57193.1 histidine kinase [Paenibacillus nasutitermitis]